MVNDVVYDHTCLLSLTLLEICVLNLIGVFGMGSHGEGRSVGWLSRLWTGAVCLDEGL